MTITQEELKKLLHYDHETGVFRWVKTRNNRSKIGASAGTISINPRTKKSYIKININNKIHAAHRLSFLYMEGNFPPAQVDHITGNGLDNRWANLRHATSQENGKNRRLQSNNTSGCVGVHWHKPSMQWLAKIRVSNKTINLGLFSNIFDAVCVRKNAEFKYGFHENHGSHRPL